MYNSDFLFPVTWTKVHTNRHSYLHTPSTLLTLRIPSRRSKRCVHHLYANLHWYVLLGRVEIDRVVRFKTCYEIGA